MQPSRRDATLVFCAALGVRLLFCAAYPSIAGDLGSGDGYDLIAQSLLRGDGFRIDARTAAVERLPFYPTVLAAVAYVCGPSAWPWQLLQSLAGAYTCVIVYRLALPLGTRRGALLAATFCILHPTLVLYAARPFTEVVFGLLVMLQIEALTTRRFVCAGLAWGGQLLTKSVSWINAVLLVPLAHRDGVRAATRVLGGAALCVMPWLAYQLYSGDPLHVASMGGRTLYQGLFISRHVGWTTPAGTLIAAAEIAMRDELQAGGVPPGADMATTVNAAGTIAQRWIMANPGAALRFFARNLLLTWYLGRSGTSMALYALLHGALLAAAVWGARRAWHAPENRLVVLACVTMIVAYTALHAAIHPGVRYVVPVIPLAAVLAAGLGARWAGAEEQGSVRGAAVEGEDEQCG